MFGQVSTPVWSAVFTWRYPVLDAHAKEASAVERVMGGGMQVRELGSYSCRRLLSKLSRGRFPTLNHMMCFVLGKTKTRSEWGAGFGNTGFHRGGELLHANAG